MTTASDRLTDEELFDLYVAHGFTGAEMAGEDPERLAEGIRDMNPEEPNPLAVAARIIRYATQGK